MLRVVRLNPALRRDDEGLSLDARYGNFLVRYPRESRDPV